MRRALVCFSVLALFLWPPAVAWGGQPQVVSSQVTHRFGDYLEFHIQAAAPAGIVKATVAFVFGADEVENLGIIRFPQPQTRVSRSYRWPLGKEICHGTVVRYRWIIEDAAGNVVEFPGGAYAYIDERRDWRTFQTDHFTVSHYGAQAGASSAAALAEEAYREVAWALGHEVAERMHLIIYGTQTDLLEAIGLPPSYWVGGTARPEYGAVLIFAIPQKDVLRTLLAHEIAHMVFHDAVKDNESLIPAWVTEGIADFVCGENPYEEDLRKAVIEGKLLPLKHLMGSFVTLSREDAIRAYAQGNSFIAYMVGARGNGSLRGLVAGLREGREFHEVVQEMFGRDVEQLEKDWHAHLVKRYKRASGVWPVFYVVLGGVAGAAGLAVALSLWRRRTPPHRWGVKR